VDRIRVSGPRTRGGGGPADPAATRRSMRRTRAARDFFPSVDWRRGGGADGSVMGAEDPWLERWLSVSSRRGEGKGWVVVVELGGVSLVVGLVRSLTCHVYRGTHLSCAFFSPGFFSPNQLCVCVEKNKKKGGNFNVTTGKAGGRQLAVREAGLPTVPCVLTQNTHTLLSSSLSLSSLMIVFSLRLVPCSPVAPTASLAHSWWCGAATSCGCVLWWC
jgi:hypothetical protein